MIIPTLQSAFEINGNQSVGNSSDGSPARTKRNSKLPAPRNLWHLVLFSLFKPDPMETGAQPTNSSQPTNTSDLVVKSLEELHFVHSAKLIPYSEETKMYFIVQMIVLGPVIKIDSRIRSLFFHPTGCNINFTGL